MRVLITGSKGQLGKELLKNNSNQWELLGIDVEDLDIRDPLATERFVADFKPGVIVNCAAYTNVEKAEEERELAFAINGDGAGSLAMAAKKVGARMVQLSTDFVFDGATSSPYEPMEEARPLSVYGASKLAGEAEVTRLLQRQGLVLRTAWLYDDGDKNFVGTILRLLREQPFLRIVADQQGTPTHVSSLAKAIYRAIEADLHGIHHWTDAGETSWHGFAVEIQRQALAQGLVTQKKEVHPVTSQEFKTKAKRPQYSVLSKESFVGETGLEPLPWQELLEASIKARLQ